MLNPDNTFQSIDTSSRRQVIRVDNNPNRHWISTLAFNPNAQLEWQSNYSSAPGGITSSEPVPKPATWLLALTAILCIRLRISRIGYHSKGDVGSSTEESVEAIDLSRQKTSFRNLKNPFRVPSLALLKLVAFFLTFGFALHAATAHAEESLPSSSECWKALVKAVPKILDSQDEVSGRFGKGVWIVQDQNVILALAVAWATPHEANPYFHDEQLLTAIMAGGDALIDEQDETGQWIFRKKDNSTWGKTHQTWTYSRWARTYGLIRDAMPLERREKWKTAISLGYTHIAALAMNRIHNIPTHHAMGLYAAGKALKRSDWCQQARSFMAKVCAEQHPDGFWSENSGPVVQYNFIYVNALGCYYSMSGDQSVLLAINRAVKFHESFVYPDGSVISTIDERNPYVGGVAVPGIGFSVTPLGRRFSNKQWKLHRNCGGRLEADFAAMLIYHSPPGPVAPLQKSEDDIFVLDEDQAMIAHQGPWTACLSAYHAPVPTSRWKQDRQNFLSLYHMDVGLILGGGNTKLQPRWSSFVVGELESWPTQENRHAIDPDFLPPEGYHHIPSAAMLKVKEKNLFFEYGVQHCSLQLQLPSPREAKLIYSSEEFHSKPITAHCTLIVHPEGLWNSASGMHGKLSKEAIRLSGTDIGDWFRHNGWQIFLPAEATLIWPVLPHNPYRKDGSAKLSEARLVIAMPLSEVTPQQDLTILVGE